ncbi:glycoside hydrolase family 9 protein [Streptomyces sp. NPDC005483]|uniref:glycoside hydrolase family 9 protein n=1 Tax=Streptomyces sp. NPDC005483 TaxID=3154882 RepID=UPI0033AD7A81
MPSLSRFGPALSVTLAAAVTAAGLVSCSADGHVSLKIRVDQAGYVTDGKKYAYVMGDGDALADARFAVVDERGDTVLDGVPGPSAGSWNSAYDTVRVVDLSALRTAGAYRLRLTGSAPGALSPRFRVASARRVTDPLRADGVRFFQTQRDGADVLAAQTGRVASHLADERATVYEVPPRGKDGQAKATSLTEVAGPVDVSGGWFDAGDYLKFTHTASYVTGLLLTVQRDTPAVPGLPAEADHGLAWLDRMWDGTDGVLYAQVGLGDGGAHLRGDHDVWRLPEEDDDRAVRVGDPDYFVTHRPVFRANAPGDPVSPNLAGRTAAAFALAAQLHAEDDPQTARGWLDKAADVYAHADTDPHGRLFTTVPSGYYGEESWQDDLEWAAAELARAARDLGDGRGARWQREAAGWAREYLAAGSYDTLGVPDVSALAHADLLAVSGSGPVRAELTAGLKRQLAQGTRRAGRDPFGAGVDLTEFDAVPRALGLVATAGLYARVTGDHRYEAFAARQRGWVFGANPWGTSFVIGAGQVYPHCPQHQVANLAMSGTGHGDILRGAVVNGPNSAELLHDLDRSAGMRACAAGPQSGGRWSDFDGQGAGYVDDVAAWQTVEPADDFTATALLSLSLTGDGTDR